MAIINSEKTYALIASPIGKKLAAAIERAGAKVIPFPQIKTQPTESSEELIGYLSEVLDFDWLIFSDVLAVNYCLERLEEATADLFNLDELHICALGEAVADRLRFVQIHTDVVPMSIQTETVFTALTDYIGDEQLSGKRFLIIKRKSPEVEIKGKLTGRGAIVVELEIYETVIEERNENARLKALVKGGAIDEFVFSSPEDLIVLQEFPAAESIAEILTDAAISAADDVTLQSLREHNLKPRRFSAK
ncbi:MAG TPA: uroporphyrinogen-III synthase [Pyrinomonadaceae bacterium]|nr:uroporphyrinogen-III synthase [Pyrinomonadaceae bacterium]